MKEMLKQQKVALEESITSLWGESKVAVKTKEDATNLCHLVKFKLWKLKLLIHDSAPPYVKTSIREMASEAWAYGEGGEGCCHDETLMDSLALRSRW
ncbi:hypothetical protein Pyn_05863 [Prunus yedoensis var. nudiflora]|uniref:Uncharacterized protein n=1 Tax=Prunus yedoensis var. nudiflora TaxID=2094558 RepID=A0A314UDS0_PRUYE|nr:hypothetical protein Pyn_05863 [Prunus yedoensis var. nudiflora]